MMDDVNQATDTSFQAQQPAKPRQNVQERFLSTLCREQVPVYIYLVNGIKLQGYINSFDQYVIYLSDPVPQIVFKRSICSIMQVHGSRAMGTPREDRAEK